MNADILSLLLTWDEYNEKEFATPYVFSIEKPEQLVIYFGAKHTNDPENPQYEHLEQTWNTFTQSTASKKIAIGEGHGKRPLLQTSKEAIEKYGEQGWLTQVAAKAGIEILYPDPSEELVQQQLEGKYSKDELFFHDVMQVAHQWNRGKKQGSFEEYLAFYIQQYQTFEGWAQYNFSSAHVQELSQQLTGKPFDEHDDQHFYGLLNPANFATRFNQLGRDIDTLRDTSIVREIIHRWKNGESIFIVFGSGHAVIQERAIKELVK